MPLSEFVSCMFVGALGQAKIALMCWNKKYSFGMLWYWSLFYGNVLTHDGEGSCRHRCVLMGWLIIECRHTPFCSLVDYVSRKYDHSWVIFAATLFLLQPSTVIYCKLPVKSLEFEPVPLALFCLWWAEFSFVYGEGEKLSETGCESNTNVAKQKSVECVPFKSMDLGAYAKHQVRANPTHSSCSYCILWCLHVPV